MVLLTTEKKIFKGTNSEKQNRMIVARDWGEGKMGRYQTKGTDPVPYDVLDDTEGDRGKSR